MHEYSIIQSLVDSVEKAVEPDSIIHRIEVRIGELSGVDCGLLATAFEVFREGTVCERTTMTIERVPAVWQCPKCTAVIERGGVLRCTTCNEPARLACGDEIILQRIEMEVADVSGLRMR
jgi:hydrogenase nickel incorporation protein HypA/HybF